MKNWLPLGTLVLILAVLVSLILGHFGFPVISAGLPALDPIPLDTSLSDLQQYPIMDRIANKIVQKYQTASCQQLYEERAQQQGRPKSAEEQRAIAILRNDPQMRQAFIDKVAAPITNTMFECGMIP